MEYEDGVWRAGHAPAAANISQTVAALSTQETSPAPFIVRAAAIVPPVDGVTKRRVLAIGDGGRIGVLEDKVWNMMDSGTRSDLLALSVGPHPFEWVAVGADGTALHLLCGTRAETDELATCTTQDDLRVAHKELYAVSGRSRADFFVAGATGVWHMTDGTVAALWTDAHARLEGLWSEGAELLAVGVDYAARRALVVRCKSAACSSERLEGTGILKDVARVGRGDFVAVGHDMAGSGAGLAFRFDSRKQTWIRVPGAPGVLSEGVIASRSGALWTVGNDSSSGRTGLVHELAGAEWKKRFETAAIPLWAIARSGAEIVAAGGSIDGGSLAVSESGRWQSTALKHLTVRSLAVRGRFLFGATTRTLYGGRTRYDVVRADLKHGSEETIKTICTAKEPINEVRALEDGSIVAVCDDGSVFFVAEPEGTRVPNH